MLYWIWIVYLRTVSPCRTIMCICWPHAAIVLVEKWGMISHHRLRKEKKELPIIYYSIPLIAATAAGP